VTKRFPHFDLYVEIARSQNQQASRWLEICTLEKQKSPGKLPGL